MNKKGILITNLGSPSELSKPALRKYLREFLSDPKVIDIHPMARYILVNFIIAPFRPRKIMSLYKNIWMDEGSPLLVYTKKIAHSLQAQLGEDYQIAWGMRYGEPSLDKALEELSHCSDITLVPLYPQYATSSTGSTLAYIANILAEKWDFPGVQTVHSFYNHPEFIEASAKKIRSYLNDFDWDHILFSYHGIPERHLKKSQCELMMNGYCSKNVCPAKISNESFCYRYQCFVSSDLIAKSLNLESECYTTSFQSRLGRTPWIKPYTDEYLTNLHAQGVRKLVVTSPSFIADCLETIDELGLRLKEQWLEFADTSFLWIPSLNADPFWVEGLKHIILGKSHSSSFSSKNVNE